MLVPLLVRVIHFSTEDPEMAPAGCCGMYTHPMHTMLGRRQWCLVYHPYREDPTSDDDDLVMD